MRFRRATRARGIGEAGKLARGNHAKRPFRLNQPSSVLIIILIYNAAGSPGVF